MLAWPSHAQRLTRGRTRQRTLDAGEKIRIDTKAVVAWEKSVHMDVVCVGGLSVMCCGGSGMYNTELTGPGLVIAQSLHCDRVKVAAAFV